MFQAQNQQQQQDDLSRLFAQTMTLNPMTPPPEARMQPPPPPLSPVEYKPVEQQVVYTSMHYTPTRHVVPVRFAHTPEATPERQLPLSDEEMIYMLEQNSIDPHSLFDSQVHLLRHADPEQRLRLLELWRISPPNVGTYDLSKQQQSWATSTLEKEEQMAKIRYERLEAERNGLFARSGSSMSDEMAMNIPTAPVPVLDRPASAPGVRSSAEPYMTSGYEMLARREYEQLQLQVHPLQETKRYRQATDPAFLGYGVAKGDQENLGYVSLMRDDDMEL
jgi:hypothetical protein